MKDFILYILGILFFIHTSWRIAQYEESMLKFHPPSWLIKILFLSPGNKFGIIGLLGIIFNITILFMYIFMVIIFKTITVDILRLTFSLWIVSWGLISIIDGFAYSILNREKIRLDKRNEDTLITELFGSGINYRKWDLICCFVLVIVFSILAFGYYHIIYQIQLFNLSRVPPSFLIVTVEKAYWLIFAFFIALSTALHPLNFVMRFLLKENYSQYKSYSDARFGPGGERFLFWYACVTIPICVVFIVLGMGYYTRFSENAIYSNDFLSFEEKSYEYSEIDSITKVWRQNDKGEWYIAPYYIIKFHDGFELNLVNKSISTRKFQEEYLNNILEKTTLKVRISEYGE